MTILMYHKIDIESPTIWWVSVDNFYRQMLELAAKQVVYLDDYNPQDPTHVVITFDGVYENVFKYAAPILQDLGYPFELFISSNYIGVDNSFDIEEPLTEFADLQKLNAMVSMGGRLQWHTKSHPDLSLNSNEVNILDELDIPRECKQLDPNGFSWFAYPYGRFNQKILELVRDRFSGAVSCDQGNNLDMHCLNRLTVTNDSSFNESKIAIIIASYNYGGFLVEAIESVLRQTRLPHEILISDDASTDNTYEIALFYQNKYPNLIKVNRNDKNMGIVPHFNKAISLTNAEYIAILGADNRFRSDYIEKTAKILDIYQDVGIAYTDFALFGQRAKLVYETFQEERKGLIKAEKFFLIHFPEFDEKSRQELLEIGNFIHGSSMFRRQAFEQVGGYTQEEGLPEDYNLFRRIVKAGWKAKGVSLPLLEYRQHSRYQTNIQLTSFGELQFYRGLCKEIRTEMQITQSQLQHTQSQLQHTQSDLEQSQSQLQHARSELERSQNNILSMESSKFWKLRLIWFRIKGKIGKLIPKQIRNKHQI